MFENKTLVALGCSHTFGVYEKDEGLSDESIMSCHERSWASKLGKLGNFKEVVNLSAPGGSNHRSERVLFDYLKENTKDIVVIFTITELSRFETIYELDGNIKFATEGSWQLEYATNNIDQIDERRLKFLEYYYATQVHDKHDVNVINRKVTMIHTLLKSLDIEHYFLEMLAVPGSVQREQLSFKIPFINFKNEDGFMINAKDWAYKNYPQHKGSCGHWNEIAQQALAEYMFNYIKDNRYE